MMLNNVNNFQGWFTLGCLAGNFATPDDAQLVLVWFPSVQFLADQPVVPDANLLPCERCVYRCDGTEVSMLSSHRAGQEFYVDKVFAVAFHWFGF